MEVKANVDPEYSRPMAERDAAQLRELIRALSKRPQDSTHGDPGGWSLRDSEQVVAEVNVDGERYLLLRIPRIERHTLRLSPREQEIVRMVGQGHPNKVIAVVLNISLWTVGTHVRRIFAKLGVNSRAAIIARLTEVNYSIEMVNPPRRK